MVATWSRCPRNLLRLVVTGPSSGQPGTRTSHGYAQMAENGKKQISSRIRKSPFSRPGWDGAEPPLEASPSSCLRPVSVVAPSPPRRTLDKAGKRPSCPLPRGGHMRAWGSEEGFCPERACTVMPGNRGHSPGGPVPLLHLDVGGT